MENRKISPNSLNIYLKNLNKLARDVTGKSCTNTKFLKKYDDIIKHLEQKSLSTRKNYVAAILVGLSPKGRGLYDKGYTKAWKLYTDYLTTQAKEYENKIIEQKKSDEQEGKCVSKKELDRVRNNYANEIRKLGYKQKVSLDEGLKITIDSYLKAK